MPARSADWAFPPLQEVMSTGEVLDGSVAQSQSQAALMWRVREGIAEAMGKSGGWARDQGANAPCLLHACSCLTSPSLALTPLAAGSVYKYDVSLPTSGMYELVEAVRARLQEGLPGRSDIRVGGYGHVGDGNLHLNVAVPSGYDPAVQALLEPFVYQWTTDRRGSISAEHGIGQMKASALHFSKCPESIAAMAQIKMLFDHRGILNPYKVLPAQPC
jgi:D-2-hydroxyglutarate dehydrogenase